MTSSRGAAHRARILVQAMKRAFGDVTIKDIIKAEGVGLGTASRIKDSIDRAAQQSVPDAGRILSFMRGQGLVRELHPDLEHRLGIEVTDLQRHLEPRIDGRVAAVIATAIKRRCPVALTYSSRRGRQDRVISPYRLIFALDRWHVRGVSHEEGNPFKDFLLSRVATAEILAPMSVKDTVSVSIKRAARKLQVEAMPRFVVKRDDEWERKVILVFVVNPDLGQHLEEMTRQEWNLEEQGNLEILVSRANALYVVRGMCRPMSNGQPRWIPGDNTTKGVAGEVAVRTLLSEPTSA